MNKLPESSLTLFALAVERELSGYRMRGLVLVLTLCGSVMSQHAVTNLIGWKCCQKKAVMKLKKSQNLISRLPSWPFEMTLGIKVILASWDPYTSQFVVNQHSTTGHL